MAATFVQREDLVKRSGKYCALVSLPQLRFEDHAIKASGQACGGWIADLQGASSAKDFIDPGGPGTCNEIIPILQLIGLSQDRAKAHLNVTRPQGLTNYACCGTEPDNIRAHEG